MATEGASERTPIEGRDGFADLSTRAVLGVDHLCDRLAPLSGAGRRRAERLAHFGPEDRSGWRRELERLKSAEAWWDAHPDARDSVEASLAELPALHKPLRTLQMPEGEREPLAEVHLFRLKRFCFFGARLMESAPALWTDQNVPEQWEDRLKAVIAEIHPGGTDHAQFHLADALDEELEQLRERRRALRDQLRERRSELEAAVTDAHGGSFDLHGHFRPPESGRDKENADEDGELEADERLDYRAGSWQLADETLDELNSEIDTLDEQLEAGERRVRRELTDALAERADWLERVAERFAAVDVRLAKIRLKRELKGCWPRLLDENGGKDDGKDESKTDGHLHLEGARHPDLVLRAVDSDQPVQPVDLETTDRPTVITGPNMGGKSALLRVVGMAQWCAQHAMPVPADAFAFRPHAHIVYVGSEEPHAADAGEGLSSFAREIRRIVEWREDCEAPTLWLLDEVGRGTHPDDGAALTADLLLDLAEAGHSVLAATHFPAVADLPGADTRVIRGLPDDAALDEALSEAAGDLEAVAAVLRRWMDYQPESAAAHGEEQNGKDQRVPRDARRVARALGLSVGRDRDGLAT